MALVADANYPRRGNRGRNIFGYPIAPGEQVYRCSLVALNAAGQLQRIQTAGSVVFAGLAEQNFNNAGVAVAGQAIVADTGTFAINVPGATFSNIRANVYATDDSTLTLTASTNLLVGVLVGIENGQTYVMLLGA